MSKKLLAFILSIILVFSLTFLVACTPESTLAIEGKWYSISQLGTVKEDNFYIFNKDGTGTTPSSAKFTWEYDAERDRYTIDGSTVGLSADKKVIAIGNSFYTKKDIDSQLAEHSILINGVNVTNKDNIISNKPVECGFSVSVNTVGSYATINGERMTSLWETVKNDGDYEFVVYNSTGEKSMSYNFTIKTTIPEPIFSVEFVVINYVISGAKNYTNQDVAISWLDPTVTATLNGSTYIKNTVITNEGAYTVVLRDNAGNTSTTMFYIYKTPPTGIYRNNSFSKICDANKLSETDYTQLSSKYQIYFTASSNVPIATVVDENGNALEIYSSRYYKLIEGVHKIIVTDVLGNISVFGYDWTIPS